MAREPEFADVKTLSLVSGIPERTIRDYTRLEENPLPCIDLPGKLQFDLAEFRKWMASRRRKPVDLGKMADETIEAMG